MSFYKYPSFRYHREKGICVVKNEAEDKALEKGWVDTPALFNERIDILEENENKSSSKSKSKSKTKNKEKEDKTKE